MLDVTDAVDRSTDSPMADSASSSRACEKRQLELRRCYGVRRRTCCVQYSAGRIPEGLDGFGAEDGDCAAGDFAAGDFAAGDFVAGDFAAGEGDFWAVFSGVLSVILGGSERPG